MRRCSMPWRPCLLLSWWVRGRAASRCKQQYFRRTDPGDAQRVRSRKEAKEARSCAGGDLSVGYLFEVIKGLVEGGVVPVQ